VIRLKGTVEYNDGRVVEWSAGSAALAEWEIYAMRNGYPIKPGEAPMILSLLVVAHAALGVAEGFDVWRPTVRDIAGDEAETATPTPRAVSAA
jgi:hypothetical protein